MLVLLLHHVEELNKQSLAEPTNAVPVEPDIGIRLEVTMERMLAIVARVEFQHDAQLAKLFGVRKQEATLYLHELKAAHFVRSAFGLDEHSRQVDIWHVEQLGRKYLAKHGLL